MQAEALSQGPGRRSEKLHLLVGCAPTTSGHSTPLTASMFHDGRQFKYAELKGFDYHGGDGTISRRDPTKVILEDSRQTLAGLNDHWRIQMTRVARV